MWSARANEPDGYLLGSYRIATAPEANSSRLTSFKSTCFDIPANNVGPWPASLGCTTNYQLLDGWIQSDGERPRELVAEQVREWINQGGLDLIRRFATDLDVINDILDEYRKTPKEERTPDGLNKIADTCDSLLTHVDEADRFFRVPESSLQDLWEEFLTHAETNAATCSKEFDSVIKGDGSNAYATAVRQLSENAPDRLLEFTKATGKAMG
ncbi:hypothetical protein [Micromonospora sp. NPDC000668]|uniref:hypothetical protein n=1 Tax=Micromonospora sp. NPDC000668 TaxID=3364219 RepID=UPI00368A797E